MATHSPLALAFWNPEESRIRAPWRLVLQLALLGAIANR
jgi:hypothetical protein